MATLQTTAIDYYRSRAQHFRHQADEIAERPRQAQQLRELATLFEKEAGALDHLLNAIPATTQPH